jgi:CHAT domain-containing protein
MRSTDRVVGYAMVGRPRLDILAPTEIWELAEGLKARSLLDDLTVEYVRLPSGAINGAEEIEREIVKFAPNRQSDRCENAKDTDSVQCDPELGVHPQRTYQRWLATEAAIDVPPILAVFDSDSESLVASLEAIMSENGAGYEGQTEPYDIERVQALLKSDEVIIEFYLPNDGYGSGTQVHCFVLTRSELKHRLITTAQMSTTQSMEPGRMIEDGPLTSLIAHLREAIEGGNETVAKKYLAVLYRWLFADIEREDDSVRKAVHWILAPHGALHLIPFGALIDSNGRHLIEGRAISIAPSASVWAELRSRPDQPLKTALALGNPMLGSAWEPLACAEKEVMDIRNAIPDSIILKGLCATMNALLDKAPGRSLLHIATHGHLPDDNLFDKHAIVISDGQGKALYLTAQEIRRCVFKMALVTLSICNGGVYRFGPGGELHGLIPAFLTAGASNVIGSHWQINDEMTGVFMVELYEALKSFMPAIALQRACIKSIERQTPLAEWSGFVLVGGGS